MATVQENVREFLAQYVLLGDAYEFDTNGYLLHKDGGSQVKLNKPNGEPAPVVLYNPVASDPNTVSINPFVDGLSSSEVSRWFYESRTLVLGGTIFKIMHGIITKVLECKNTSLEDVGLNSAEIAIVQPYLSGAYEVDSKMEKELNSIYHDLKSRNFFNIYFSRKTNACTVNAALFDEEQMALMDKKLRKKAIPVFNKMFLDILGVSDIRELVTTADLQGCAKFNAYTKMFVQVLKGMKKYWTFQNKTFEFKKFFDHVDNFQEYFNTAKMVVNVPMSQPTAQPQQQGAPWDPQQPSVPVGAVPMGASVPVMQPGAYVQQSVPMGMNTPVTSVPMQPSMPIGNPYMGQSMGQPMMGHPTNQPMMGYSQPMMQQQQFPSMQGYGMPQTSVPMGQPMQVGNMPTAVPMMTIEQPVSPSKTNHAPFLD